MFLLRLKTEFSENLKLVIALWITLGVIAWSFYQWWFGPLAEPANSQQVINVFAALGVVLIGFFLISTLFKRDDLKHPQEFWATRPIRSFTFFGTKLVFAWLVIALPCGVMMTLLGLIAGVGMTAVWNALELMLWVIVVTNLLALSCMAYPGNRALLGFLCFFGGVILMCIAMNNAPLEAQFHSYGVSQQQQSWNLLIALISLNAWFGWRCWQIIRNKHTNEHPLVLFSLGVLTVLLVAFVPIPGGLSEAGIGTPSKTLPAVTKGTFLAYNMSHGEKYGAKFASVNIELDCGESMQGGGWEFMLTKLNVVGEDKSLHGVEVEMMKHLNDRADQPPQTNLVLEYSIYDRKPAHRGRISSSSNSRGNDILSKVPRRKVRIQGTVTMNRIEFRELARSPLDRPFSHREQGIACEFHPLASSSSDDDYNASWKIFSPSLMTSNPGQRGERVRFRLEDPKNPEFAWIDQLGGNSSGGGAFFGSYRMNDLRISDQELESDYYWKKLRESGYTKTMQEWKKDVHIICEVVDRINVVVLPVDIEVEVPDAEKVRELLVKGEL